MMRSRNADDEIRSDELEVENEIREIEVRIAVAEYVHKVRSRER